MLSGSNGICIVCVWLFQCAYCVGTRKGQWVIGTGQMWVMWVMWMTLSTRSSGMELCSVSEVSQSSGAGLLLTPLLEFFLCSHARILMLHHYVSLVRIPTPAVSVCPLCLSVSASKQFAEEVLQYHNEFRRRHQAPPLKLSNKLSREASRWVNANQIRNLISKDYPNQSLSDGSG